LRKSKLLRRKKSGVKPSRNGKFSVSFRREQVQKTSEKKVLSSVRQRNTANESNKSAASLTKKGLRSSGLEKKQRTIWL